LPKFFLKRFAFVDLKLTVISNFDRISFKGTRGGAFEIDPIFVKPTAVTRTLEFLFSLEPIWGATKVRAYSF
jgi:hypothetical protein